jgi:ATP-dependent 26S proteasome regulatory subunit
MTLADDLDLEEYITAKDDLSGADIKVRIVQLHCPVLLLSGDGADMCT